MKDLVFISDKGNPITNSLLVAEYFEKEHKHVLETLRNLVADMSAANKKVSEYYYVNNYINRGKEYPMYIMNYDGFVLLSMRFKGKKALEFQLNFIEAFSSLKQQLKAALQPKVDFAERIIADETTFDFSQVAKLLNLPYGRNKLIENLKKRGVLFTNRTEPKQQYINHGYFRFTETEVNVNGNCFPKLQTKVTQKGLFWLANQLQINQPHQLALNN